MQQGVRRGCSIVAVLVALLGGQRAADARGAAGSCSCSDVKDLINRIAMAEAAIEKFRAEIPVMQKQQVPPLYDRVVPGTSQTNYDALRASVIAAQAAVQDPGAHGGTGSTNGISCETEVKAETACLTEVLQVHEDHHALRCTAERKDRRLVKGEDRFRNKLLVDYANEEISGYQQEIDEALRRLRAIDPSCRPSDWFGTIRVEEARSMEVTTTSPRGEYTDGTTRTSKEQFRRWGTIVVGRSPDTAYWQVQHLVTGHDTQSGRVACGGGAKQQPANRRVNNTHHEEISFTGVSRDVPSVDIDVEATSYSLGFSITPVDGESTITGYDKSTGGCEEINKSLNGGPYANQIPASERITVRGTTKPKATSLSGSYKVPMPVPGTPGVTFTHDLVVYWHLHKL